MVKVFVYGTLKAGYSNHIYLKTATHIKQTTVKGDLLHLHAFPGLVKGNNDVLGEVYEVDAETLKWLDYLESNGKMYKRKLVDGVWVYYLKMNRHYKRFGKLTPNEKGQVIW